MWIEEKIPRNLRQVQVFKNRNEEFFRLWNVSLNQFVAIQKSLDIAHATCGTTFWAKLLQGRL
jgi:hypothetical protein